MLEKYCGKTGMDEVGTAFVVLQRNDCCNKDCTKVAIINDTCNLEYPIGSIIDYTKLKGRLSIGVEFIDPESWKIK